MYAPEWSATAVPTARTVAARTRLIPSSWSRMASTLNVLRPRAPTSCAANPNGIQVASNTRNVSQRTTAGARPSGSRFAPTRPMM